VSDDRNPVVFLGNPDGNEIKSSLWYGFLGLSAWFVLWATGITSGLTTPLLNIIHNAPILPISLAAAIIGGRAILARDVAITDAAAALAPVALALYLGTIQQENRQLGLDQWEVMSLIGGLWAAIAIACARPSILLHWKILPNGTRYRIKRVKQNGTYMEYHEDSRTRNTVWKIRNTTLFVIIMLCAGFCALFARLVDFTWLAVWAAVVVQVYCLALFGWSQIRRLDFVAYHPIAREETPAEPPKHQTQTQQPRRKKIS
jgi:hypothetical protein